MKKKVLAIALSVWMIITAMPMNLWASGETNYVAEIGTVKYETLQAAFNAAENGDTVKLLANAEKQNLTFDKPQMTVTLDLNGYTVSDGPYAAGDGSYTMSRTIYVSQGILVIDDTSAAGTGKIVSKADSTVGNYALYLYGKSGSSAKVILNKGTIDSRKWGLFISSRASAEINGGKIIASGCGPELDQAIQLSGDALTINGGEFESDGKVLFVYDTSEINGGFFKGTIAPKTPFNQGFLKGGYYDQDPSAYVAEDYKCVATDETDEANGVDIDIYKFKILGAKVAKIGTTKYSTLAEALKAATSGDVIEILPGTWGADAIGSLTTGEANEVRYKSLTIQPATAGTVTFTSNISLGYDDSSTANASMTVKGLAFRNASLGIGNYRNVLVEDCTFEGCTFEEYVKNYAGTLIIRDACSVNHKTQGTYPASSVIVRNCTIDGSPAGEPGIRLRDAGNVTLTGNTIKNTGHNGILFENSKLDTSSDLTITITDNTVTEWNVNDIEGGGRAIRAALETLSDGSVVTINDNIFLKENLGKDEPDFIKITGVGNATVNLNHNGWNYLPLASVSENADFYTVQTVKDATAASPALESVIYCVAEIGSEKYETLKDALDAVPTDGTPTTIKMIADEVVNYSTSLIIGRTKNVTLDLNGHTVTGVKKVNTKDFIWVENGSTLTIQDNSDEQDGLLTSDAFDAATVFVEGAVILESGTVASTGSADASLGGCVFDVRPNDFGISQGYEYVTDESTLTINGGVVRGNNSNTIRIASSAVEEARKTQRVKVVMNGGLIENGGDAFFIQLWTGIPCIGNLELEINGGELKCTRPVRAFSTSWKTDRAEGQGSIRIAITGGKISKAANDTKTYWKGVAVQNIAGGGTVENVESFMTVEIKGGFFTYKDTLAAGLVKGKSVTDTPEGPEKAAGYIYMVGEPQQQTEVQEDIQITNDPTDSGKEDTEAKEMVENAVNNNDAVNNFSNTGIREAVEMNDDSMAKIKDGFKSDAEGKNLSADVAEKVEQAIDALTKETSFFDYVKVKASAATVSNFKVVTAIGDTEGTTIKQMGFDVKPMMEVTIIPEGGEPVTVTTVIPNEYIKAPIAFRLTVEDSVPVGTIVDVYHSDSELYAKGEFFGRYAVQEENGKKFVEPASDHFSFFTYELTETVIGTANYTATLNLADSIGILFYINNPTGELAKYKVSATYKSENTNTTLDSAVLTEVGADKKYCVVIADCAAAEMFEKVHVVVTYDGVTIKEFDYSVYDYCNNKINNVDTKEILKELCKSALDYGTYAKVFFKYQEMNAVAYDYEERSMADVTATGTSASKTGLCDGVTAVSATLSLESKTKILFYLTVEDSSIQDFDYEVSGSGLVSATPTVSIDEKGRIQVEVAGIAAAKLGEIYTLTVTSKNDGSWMTISYSPMGYATTKQTSGTPDLPNLVKALYKYYQAADAFFKQE